MHITVGMEVLHLKNVSCLSTSLAENSQKQVNLISLRGEFSCHHAIDTSHVYFRVPRADVRVLSLLVAPKIELEGPKSQLLGSPEPSLGSPEPN